VVDAVEQVFDWGCRDGRSVAFLDVFQVAAFLPAQFAAFDVAECLFEFGSRQLTVQVRREEGQHQLAQSRLFGAVAAD